MLKTAIALGALVMVAGSAVAFRGDIQNQLIVRGVMACPANSDGRTISRLLAELDRLPEQRVYDICDAARGWHQMYLIGGDDSRSPDPKRKACQHGDKSTPATYAKPCWDGINSPNGDRAGVLPAG